MLENPTRDWKRAVFSQYPRGWPRAKFEGYSIKTNRYNYIQWKELDGSFKGHELYDHKLDPIESINVVEKQEYQIIVQEMNARLQAGWKAALPEGITNNSDNAPAPDFVPWGKEAMFGPYAKQ